MPARSPPSNSAVDRVVDPTVDPLAAPDLPWVIEPARAIARTQRGHALLLQGRAGDGVFDLGLRVARGMLCEAGEEAPVRPCGACAACLLLRARSHADLRVLMPEATRQVLGWSADAASTADSEPAGEKRKPGRDIKIDAVRQAIAWTQTSSARGRGKWLLLYPADAMNPVAANALLKTLEEPPGGTRVVLVVEDAQRLLPTLRSRCQRILFDGPTPAEALAWLAAQGVADPEVLLKAAGGQPLAARELAREGLDPAGWAALPRAVAEGRWTPPAQWSVTRLREVLQKLCHDAMAQAAGAAPRYFPADSLPGPADWSRLAAWSNALTRLARHEQHPLSAPLRLDSVLIEAQGVWAPARARPAEVS